MNNANQLNDIMIHTLLQQPFYGSLLSTMTRIETRDIPTAGVTMKDRPILYYNPDFLSGLTTKESSGVLIHEMLHLILLHQFRRCGRDHNIWNIACDIAVNQMIDNGYLPDSALTVESMSEVTQTFLRRGASADEYYDILIKDKDMIKSLISESIKDSTGGSAGSMTIDIPNSSGDASRGVSKKVVVTLEDLNEADQELAKAILADHIESAKQAGNTPHELNRALNTLYAPPQMNWRMLLRNFMNSRGRLKYEYTYKRESRRFPGAPGKRKLSGMNILIGIDESGSVADKDLLEFVNELRAVQKITGTNVYVVPFDTEVGRPMPLRQYIMRGERTRGGGTCFEPVFDLAKKMRIDTVIVFSDGYASIPESIAPKTLWVITGNGRLPEEGTSVQFAS